ncbi:unnamed protein product [Vicia faba]|uniref:CG-1 domain-containing protein n=1 Tax=Vicia faba TaxID=3906 RepID=A0AAV0YHD6_VICFA|nr:unnamed protein product [Vicia faba]
MAQNLTEQLVGSEIHGFHTLSDLDVGETLEEAKSRWLRPNEIHAILSNYKYFTIHVKPLNLPKSGTVVLFDRKMLRNFRKDGHNWKKKNDGKTVKEAHEHLKVGNEERIHVYYAHGQDYPSFVRRCYWLLDKSLEHIVLVHYRETQESQGSPITPVSSLGCGLTQSQGSPFTPVNSNSSSISDPTTSWIPSEDLDSGTNSAFTNGLNGNLTGRSLEQKLHELNTCEWEDLVASHGNTTAIPNGGGNESHFYQLNQRLMNGSVGNSFYYQVAGSPGEVHSFEASALESSIASSVHDPFSSLPMEHNQQPSLPEQVFHLTELAPAWASSTEKTKVLVTGYFHNDYQHFAKSNLVCVCGETIVPVEIVQVGVYRCWVMPHSPGFVNLYLSFDGHKPISQIVNFEYRTPILHDPTASMEDTYNWIEFRLQMRLSHLLFTTQKTLDLFSSKVSPTALEETKKFASRTLFISKSLQHFMKSSDANTPPFPQAKNTFFEIALKNKLREWLLERIVLRCKTAEYDAHGQGVIHLCTLLGYTWAITLFSWSGLSLDFRDKFGWTALHWAAYNGMEKMVATLLSCGARPNLVTDPTPQNPGGCTAADLAYMNGYDGLAAYLSEKSLVEQFNDMSLAGNISGSLETTTTDPVNPENLTEDQLYLKDTLAAYRTTAEAAARIQAAFREHSLKLRYQSVQFSSPEEEARQIVAAMKIQHAFRNFETRKTMAAAVHIQHRFRTWKLRKKFLHMRCQAIKIQAAFRGFQVRRQYRKILWSVGILEKAILRWRLKRKGFRGLEVSPVEDMINEKHESDVEEEFFKTGRKQAEERVERSVVRVQAMFRSKKAQQEYSRMKMAHSQAKLELELEDLLNSDVDMLTTKTA